MLGSELLVESSKTIIDRLGLSDTLFGMTVGVGRFAKIGIPAPEVMAPLVGVVEIVCGTLVLKK